MYQNMNFFSCLTAMSFYLGSIAIYSLHLSVCFGPYPSVTMKHFATFLYNPATDQAVRYESTTNMHKPKHHSGMLAGSGTWPELKYRASQHCQHDP